MLLYELLRQVKKKLESLQYIEYLQYNPPTKKTMGIWWY